MSLGRRLQRHLRKTLLTGVFAAIPLAMTVAIVVYIEHKSREPARALLGLDIPFIGVLFAIGIIYVLGLIVTSIVGKVLLAALDRLLLRVPVLAELYKAWKQISLTPGGREGIYSEVVLIPDGANYILGFTSGDPLDGDPEHCMVYVPESPNPMSGRLVVAPRARCVRTGLSAEEAFKMILSGGNYVHERLARATRGDPPPPTTSPLEAAEGDDEGDDAAPTADAGTAVEAQ
ncbi:MAG: DUF502 domain-containing protein [Nannocystaceae bacterium]